MLIVKKNVLVAVVVLLAPPLGDMVCVGWVGWVCFEGGGVPVERGSFCTFIDAGVRNP